MHTTTTTHARGCTFDANGVELVPCPYCDGVNAPMCPDWCQVDQDEHGRQLVTSEGVYVHTCQTSPDGAPYLVQVTRVQRVALCHGSPALLGFEPAGVYVSDAGGDDLSAEDASDMAAALVRAAGMALATREGVDR